MRQHQRGNPIIDDLMLSECWSSLLKSRRSLTKNPGWKKGVEEKIIRLVVHEGICYVAYKMRKGQFLLKVMQEKQMNHTKKLINNLKHPLQPNMLWFLTFCQDQINSQNNRTGGSLSHPQTCPESCRKNFQQEADAFCD